MKRGRKALSPLQKQINDSLGIPWVPAHPMEQVIYGFWLAVRKAGPDECWLWTKPPMRTGYGQLSVNGTHWTAHAFAYYVTNFGVEPGLHIDHVCHNDALDCAGGSACRHRLCCNPRHLLAKTPQANVDAANAARKRAAFKEQCAKGHPYDDENTGWLIRKSGPRAGERQRYC